MKNLHIYYVKHLEHAYMLENLSELICELLIYLTFTNTLIGRTSEEIKTLSQIEIMVLIIEGLGNSRELHSFHN